MVAATRIDPLRPDNPDFELVGPGWLAVAAFGLASVFHGMAVVAMANRYSREVPPAANTRVERVRRVIPLAATVLLLTPGLVLIVPIVVVGLAITIAASRIEPVVRFVHGRGALIGGRVAVVLVTVALLPGTVTDVHEVIVQDDDAALRSVP